jgi:T4 bacteriophage base plate protein
MPLPKISTPLFELNLPSSGKSIKYRPFLVKEQKILLLAMEGDDAKAINNAIKQIITNCSTDEIDVDKLPTFDLEYVFTKLRAKSIGENVDLKMRHPNSKNKKGEECTGETLVKVDLMTLEVSKGDGHTDTIVLDEETGIGVKMRYPTLTNDMQFSGDETELELAAMSIGNAIEYVFDKENVYKREDQTLDEINEFIDNLSQAQFEKLAKFFSTMPKLKQTIKWKCTKCKQDEEVTVEGMTNFFAF